MIKNVTVTNHLGDSLTLQLDKTDTGLAITGIDGLYPPKATINTSSLGGQDGVTFNSTRIDTRNIVLDLRFVGVGSIEDLRLLTYQFFPIKRKVTFAIETDRRKAAVEGYVESNEANIFSPESGTTISMITDPYFYDISGQDTKVNFYGITPLFEFPFSNESLTTPLIVMGEHLAELSRSFVYPGDAVTGVVTTIEASGTLGNITVGNPETGEGFVLTSARMTAVTGQPVSDGDTIIIDSRIGKKSVTLWRAGTITNILSALGPIPGWINVRPGINTFEIGVSSGIQNARISMEYPILYEGV